MNTANPNEIKDKLKWAKKSQNLGNVKDIPQGFYRTEGTSASK